MVQNYLTWSKTVQIFHMHFWSWNFRKILFFGTPCSWCFCWSWSLVKFTSLNEEPCLFSRQSEDRTSPNPIISLTFVVFWCSLRCFHICFDWAIDALCLDQNEKVVLAKHSLNKWRGALYWSPEDDVEEVLNDSDLLEHKLDLPIN